MAVENLDKIKGWFSSEKEIKYGDFTFTVNFCYLEGIVYQDLSVDNQEVHINAIYIDDHDIQELLAEHIEATIKERLIEAIADEGI